MTLRHIASHLQNHQQKLDHGDPPELLYYAHFQKECPGSSHIDPIYGRPEDMSEVRSVQCDQVISLASNSRKDDRSIFCCIEYDWPVYHVNRTDHP